VKVGKVTAFHKKEEVEKNRKLRSEIVEKFSFSLKNSKSKKNTTDRHAHISDLRAREHTVVIAASVLQTLSKINEVFSESRKCQWANPPIVILTHPTRSGL